VRVYAESSAILAWLLGERGAHGVVEELARASLVAASELTFIEVERGLHRATRDGRLNEAERADATALLRQAGETWSVLEIGDEIAARAKRPFPQEPVRTLDAIHLASALAAREGVGPLAVLSLDDRIRRSARELGFDVVPPLGDMVHEVP